MFEAYQRWQLELERQPVEFLGRRFRRLMHHARQRLAAYLGAAAEDVVFVTNATTALNLAARSLSLQSGDEVLTTDHEYGAIDRTWRFICQQRGARCVVQPLDPPFESRDRVVDTIWSAVTPRTKVLALSHITSPTAITLPLAPIVRRAREAGIVTVIDGAHAPGQVPLNLEALGADFYAGNCHKWMCAPKGAAFLYVRKEVQGLLQPLVVSWGWQPNEEWLGDGPFITTHEWQGTRDISAYLAVPAALDFMARHGWPSVQRRCHKLARYGRQRVSQLTGLAPLTSDSPDWYGQMVALPLPPCEPAALKRQLYEKHRVEVPIIVWRDRPFIRLSLQAYNSEGDIDALAKALRAQLSRIS